MSKGFGWRKVEMGKPFCLSVLGLKVNSDSLSTLKGSEELQSLFFLLSLRDLVSQLFNESNRSSVLQ